MNTNYHHHPPSTRTSTATGNETGDPTPKKTSSSPRRQTTRSTSNLTTKDDPSSANIQIFKPVAVRPSSDATAAAAVAAQNSYNLRSRTKLKNSNATEVIPSFTEKLSLDAPSMTMMTQQKPVPPLTRAAAASAGVKIDSIAVDESTKAVSSTSKFPHSSSQSNISTRSSTTRKRKASDDDHRPYLDLLKMKQTQSTYSFDSNSPKKMTRRADQDCIGGDDEDSGCDYDSPSHSPVDFTDVPPGHVFHFEESNMSYDSGFSTGSGELNHQQQQQQQQRLSQHSQTSSSVGVNSSGIATRSSTIHCSKYPAAIDLDVNAIEGDLGF